MLPYVILVRPSAVEEDEVKGGKSPFLHRTCAVLETRASTCFCFFFYQASSCLICVSSQRGRNLERKTPWAN